MKGEFGKDLCFMAVLWEKIHWPGLVVSACKGGSLDWMIKFLAPTGALEEGILCVRACVRACVRV